MPAVSAKQGRAAVNGHEVRFDVMDCGRIIGVAYRGKGYRIPATKALMAAFDEAKHHAVS